MPEWMPITTSTSTSAKRGTDSERRLAFAHIAVRVLLPLAMEQLVQLGERADVLVATSGLFRTHDVSERGDPDRNCAEAAFLSVLDEVGIAPGAGWVKGDIRSPDSVVRFSISRPRIASAEVENGSPPGTASVRILASRRASALVSRVRFSVVVAGVTSTSSVGRLAR
jgi:hypothetical protein